MSEHLVLSPERIITVLLEDIRARSFGKLNRKLASLGVISQDWLFLHLGTTNQLFEFAKQFPSHRKPSIQDVFSRIQNIHPNQLDISNTRVGIERLEKLFVNGQLLRSGPFARV